MFEAPTCRLTRTAFAASFALSLLTTGAATAQPPQTAPPELAAAQRQFQAEDFKGARSACALTRSMS